MILINLRIFLFSNIFSFSVTGIGLKWVENIFCIFFSFNVFMKSSFSGSLTLSQISPGFCKHFGKRRNCSSRAISPFPTVFSHSVDFENFLPFSSNLKLTSANSFTLEESKVCHLGKG